MAKGTKLAIAAAAVLSVIVAGVFWIVPSENRTRVVENPAAGVEGPNGKARIPKAADKAASRGDERPPADEASDEGEKPEDESEKPEKEEPLSPADAFDAVVDKWQEPSESGVTMDDVDAFAAAFRAVPEDAREDGIRRALNLIPDENALLLAGVLMDKAQEKDIVELVFNDVLNRGEEVKTPILKQIFKDKSHPCWADAAWIFDATGEDPGK